MKILIAAGIFIPEIGGPATYIANLSQELVKSGHQVTVVTYSDKDSYETDKDLPCAVYRIARKNKLSNYYRYYKKIKEENKNEIFDILYAFDHFSAGIPASWLAKKSNKPLIIRVGGDFIWERYLTRANDPVTLRQFYEKKLHLKEEKFRFKLIKKVFKQASKIVFTTKFQQDIFVPHYQLPADKLTLISNPVNTKIQKAARENISKEIIFYGRFINKNNLHNLLTAFEAMQDKSFSLVLIGDGVLKDDIIKRQVARVSVENKMNREELHQRLQAAYLTVFPSLTDISPNSLLESLALGVPFVSTTEIGFDWLKDKVRMFDPNQPEELTKHLDQLAQPENYQAYQQRLTAIDYSYNYQELAQDTIRVLNETKA
jgi:glycosyltransferase involved in cell wall biosynthesis